MQIYNNIIKSDSNKINDFSEKEGSKKYEIPNKFQEKPIIKPENIIKNNDNIDTDDNLTENNIEPQNINKNLHDPSTAFQGDDSNRKI